MSDVSNYLPLNSPLTINPFHQLKIDAINILRAEGRLRDLAGRELDIKYLLESDTFKDLYRQVEELGESVDSFKIQIKAIINCNLAVGTLSTPDNPIRTYQMCREAACENRCASYRARIKKVKYPANISAIRIMNDQAAARDLTHKIAREAKELDIDWIKVVDTPLHDGRSIVRIINLRLPDMNPLDGDDQIRETYAEFMTLYPEFDPAHMTSDPEADYEVKYITDSGFKFNTTQLWTSRKVGRKGSYKNEGGSRKGWEFDYELGQMIHMTDDERKKKRREDQGIIGYINAPSFNFKGMDLETVEDVVLQGIEKEALPGDKAIFSASEYDSVNHTTVSLVQAIQDAAMAMGFHQDTSLYVDVPIYKERYDNFIETMSTGIGNLPDDIMTIEFTPEMLDVREGKGLREKRQIIHNKALFKAQAVIIKAPTKKELANKIARCYLRIE